MYFHVNRVGLERLESDYVFKHRARVNSSGCRKFEFVEFSMNRVFQFLVLDPALLNSEYVD